MNAEAPSLGAENPLWLSPADVLGTLDDVEEKHAPKQLFYVGDRSLLERGPRVSVVGSRKATAEGLRRAQSLTKALVAHQIVVVSGLAEGIDTAAHTTAIAVVLRSRCWVRRSISSTRRGTTICSCR
jgi:hypothetical protein